jgi:hypothetical protein
MFRNRSDGFAECLSFATRNSTLCKQTPAAVRHRTSGTGTKEQEGTRPTLSSRTVHTINAVLDGFSRRGSPRNSMQSTRPAPGGLTSTSLTQSTVTTRITHSRIVSHSRSHEWNSTSRRHRTREQDFGKIEDFATASRPSPASSTPRVPPRGPARPCQTRPGGKRTIT